jgi:catechol 2,3-dioxygenase-like lactoylglutathione lyase family enzyme
MRTRPLPISSVNHVSFQCTCVAESVAFYEDVLGFISIKRPGSFDFDGAWYAIHQILDPIPLHNNMIQ